jgi:hypothetical protein
MSTDRWDDLQKEARKRSEQARTDRKGRGGRAPAPGDLFVLPETADFPVEWAILDRDPGPPERLHAVPADANPLAGSADVEVPAGEPGGPLNLRCRYGVWIGADAFQPERRTGALAPAAVEEARHKWRELERGEPSASPLAWEVDADPEYQDWLADTAAPARAALEARRSAPKRPGGGGRLLPFPGSKVHLLAAALFAACIGLSVWVALLQQTVDRLSESVFDVPVSYMDLGGDSRGLPDETVVRVPPGASRFAVLFVFDQRMERGTGHFEIVAPDGEVLSRSGPMRIKPTGESAFFLPRERFPDGRYRVRLLEGSGPGGRLLDEAVLTVETAEEEPEMDSSPSSPRVPQ